MNQKLIEQARLTGEEIGDKLDLEDESSYHCSDGSITSTVSVDKLLQAQLEKAIKVLVPAAKKEERESIIAWGIEPCPHWVACPDIKVIKRDCALCWQALKSKEEIK